MLTFLCFVISFYFLKAMFITVLRFIQFYHISLKAEKIFIQF